MVYRHLIRDLAMSIAKTIFFLVLTVLTLHPYTTASLSLLLPNDLEAITGFPLSPDGEGAPQDTLSSTSRSGLYMSSGQTLI